MKIDLNNKNICIANNDNYIFIISKSVKNKLILIKNSMLKTKNF